MKATKYRHVLLLPDGSHLTVEHAGRLPPGAWGPVKQTAQAYDEPGVAILFYRPANGGQLGAAFAVELADEGGR